MIYHRAVGVRSAAVRTRHHALVRHAGAVDRAFLTDETLRTAVRWTADEVALARAHWSTHLHLADGVRAAGRRIARRRWQFSLTDRSACVEGISLVLGRALALWLVIYDRAQGTVTAHAYAWINAFVVYTGLNLKAIGTDYAFGIAERRCSSAAR